MKPSYFPQLDGVRAIAILTVMGGHFFYMLPRHASQFASLGVVLFFCLSGFLITRILLGLPHRQEGESLRGLVSFYARRSLRIFPIYYLTIVAAALTIPGGPRECFLRLATYTIGIPGLPPVSLGPAGHLWSLSVEEQFYLVWPFVIVFLPRRFLHGAILGAVGLGFAYKVAVIKMNLGFGWAFRPLAGSLDALGLGALLALYLDEPGLREKGMPWLLAASRWVGWPCFLILIAWRLMADVDSHTQGLLGTALILSSGALASVGLIHFAVQGRRGPLGRVLAFPALVFVGKISYGLYLYHYFMIYVVPRAAGRLGYFPSPLTIAALEIAASFAAAVFSWYLVERPILGLKRNFAYRRR